MQDIENFILKRFKVKLNELLKKNSPIEFNQIIESICYEESIRKETLHLSNVYDWFNQVYNHSYLDFFFAEGLQEIIIHNNKTIEIHSNKGKEKVNVDFLSEEDLELSYDILCKKYNLSWNYSKPFVSFGLVINSFQFRCTLIHQSASPAKRSKLFLRRINTDILELNNFNLNTKEQEIIKRMVTEKNNIVISGATASGKTSFLKTMIKSICEEEHIVVIEDTHEISGNSDRFTHLISDNRPGKSMKEFCEYSLRLSPERILLGEIRGKEVIPFILASNTGHKGMMTSIHANDAKSTLVRLGTLFSIYSENQGISFEQVMSLVCSDIDYVIHLKEKEVSEIIQVKGCQKGIPIFEYIKKDSISQLQEESFPPHLLKLQMKDSFGNIHVA